MAYGPSSLSGAKKNKRHRYTFDQYSRYHKLEVIKPNLRMYIFFSHYESEYFLTKTGQYSYIQ